MAEGVEGMREIFKEGGTFIFPPFDILGVGRASPTTQLWHHKTGTLEVTFGLKGEMKH